MKITVQFQCDVPDEATEEELLGWLRFELREACEFPIPNIMNGTELSATWKSTRIVPLHEQEMQEMESRFEKQRAEVEESLARGARRTDGKIV